MSKHLIKSDTRPSQDEWIRDAAEDPSSERIGMYLTHTGIVRRTARACVRDGETDTLDVTGMSFSYDEVKVERAIEAVLRLPGIYYVKVWLNHGDLTLGDTIMQVLIGGDIRPHVIDGLQQLVGTIKNHCVTEEEKY